MRRFLGSALAVLLSLISSEIAHAAPLIWVESSMAKILRTGLPPSPAATSATISAAKNEFEAFQIAIRSDNAPLTINDISATALADGAGHSIAANQIMIYREHYLNITKPTVEGTTGWYPDALIPKVDAYLGEPRNAFGPTGYQLPANTTQAFWIEVYIPSDAPAGTYTGTATVTANGSILATVPISLQVWDFALPSTASLKSAFSVTHGNLQQGHDGGYVSDDQTKNLLKLYTLALLRHRLSNQGLTYPPPLPSWPLTSTPDESPNWVEDFDAQWSPFLDGSGTVYLSGGNPLSDLAAGPLPGARLTTIGVVDWSYAGNSTLYQNYATHFVNKGWFQWPDGSTRLFYYICDEPNTPTSDCRREPTSDPGPSGQPWDYINTRADTVHSMPPPTPPHRVMATTSFERAKALDPPTPGDPENPDPDYGHVDVSDKIDVYAPNIRYVEDKPGSDLVGGMYVGNHRPQYLGELWWYQACDTHGCVELTPPLSPSDRAYLEAFPAYMADVPNMYSRVMEWLSYRYNIQGELYYDTITAYQHWRCDLTNGVYDPWSSIYCFGGNGDGTLFYPGIPNLPRDGVGSSVEIGGNNDIPIESMRLKMIRDGMEDYEYLKQAEAQNGRAWVDATIIPLVADSAGTFATYAWNKDAGSPTSSVGLLRAREVLGATLSGTVPQPTDDFSRSDSTNLGPAWNEYLPDLEIVSGQVRNVTVGNMAAVFTQSLGPDHDVSADCKVTTTGNMCAVMARWSDADNYYHARLDVGQGNIKLYKTVGGVGTEIGTAARSLTYDTYYRIRLVVVGTALSVYFGNENTAAIAASDASLTAGVYGGIRTYAAAASAAWFDNFTASPITGAWTRWEETDSRIGWSPGPWPSGTATEASGGGFVATSGPGDALTLPFTGTGIKWLSPLEGCSGQATVTLDGVDYAVDNYRSPNQGWQSVAWEIAGLAPTSHTFQITVLGTKQAASCGPWIYFDAVDILS